MSQKRERIDRQLVRKINCGDKAAFKRFYLHYFETLFRFCQRYVHSRPAAESIVQEVFADIWDKEKAWMPERSVRV